MESPASCVFCDIVDGRLPSHTLHREDGLIVFRNQLNWFPVQLLVVPTRHMTQLELWASGDLMARAARLAATLGSELCPKGYRLLSNFGEHGMQSQPHAHIHIVGGEELGLYVRPYWMRGTA